ncbi:hypothetical protein FH608_048140 [Nonomuraea phyllanthi]|uniref:DUF7701 domain-containing protein n=1 Tax=Nonomuraea phyllanthi TaxID=2219224 RepID=A0A5C4V1M3_9ACTN|nr:hypothetical protein [Nonomuraea phyllanthi]KAB8184744.1 hypothetical protein FH608_048140 [Nonomuraea phyllanthi]QFY09362.1 hypothetical protein GBF35_24370 [Nonomuraea phyllanthi]
MSYLDADAHLIRSLLPAQAAPPDDAAGLFVLYAVLLRAKGEEVSAEDVHDAWSAWMSTRDPGHPALVPFADLPISTRAADEPYVVAIRAAASQRRR